ncbi:unnamed protein product [Cochlearia groenlandica]
MQRERASLGSLPEKTSLDYERERASLGSSSSNAVIDQQIRWENIHNLGDSELRGYKFSAADTNTTFSNSVYHDQLGLRGFSLGESSSSGVKSESASHSHADQWMEIRGFEERRNEKLELNPLFMQPSGGNNRVIRNVNLNAEYNGHLLEDLDHVTCHNGPESSVRASSSVDGLRVSCKRKALDSSIGQSSSSGGFREFQRGESSSWVSAPAFYSSANDRGPQGLVFGSAPGIPESSRRNFSVRVNPIDHQETVSPAVYSVGSVIRRPVAPSLNSPGLVPVDQQLFDLRHGHGLGNASATRTPPVSRNIIPPFQWSGSPVAGGGSTSSAAPVERNVVHRDQTRQRSNFLEIPLFSPSPELQTPAHSHFRNVTGAGHVSLSSSRTSVQPSPSSPSLTPYQNHLPHNQRRLSELRRSLLASRAQNQRAARSLVQPASPDWHAFQSAGDNASQGQNRAYSRAGPRQGQDAVGAPYSLQGSASTSRGRRRLDASEIRNLLDHMRRAGSLRFEDVMLLNQSIALGVADTHDRYRDMRLDVDNMSYEELLSLEERIGDVCTGLKEETISSRLKEHRYKSSTCPQEVEPCCICQEDYKEGEEMGMLECGHDFHGQCIKEWLKRKNLCPICKTKGLNTEEKP